MSPASRFETQRRLRRGLGACWEECFAGLQHVSAPFQLLTTLSDSVDWDCVTSRRSIGLPAFGRFPQVSAIAAGWMSNAFQMLPKPAEIDQAWPFGCYLRSAGALLRLRATVNKIRLFPRPLVSSVTLRRAPAREDVRPAPRKAETCVCVSPFSLLRAGARLSFSLVAEDQGTMCTLLMVADMERARLRTAGTEKGHAFAVCAVSRRPSDSISAS